MVQSIGFGCQAVFRDSIEGQKRDFSVTGNAKLAGVRTNAENAAALQDVVDYFNENRLAEDAARGRRLLTFGDVPGFCWIFDMPSGLLSHDWPDMNTYPAAQMKEDLEAIYRMDSEPPLVILCPENVDFEDPQEAEKWALLQEFLQGYGLVMDNGTYQIYDLRG